MQKWGLRLEKAAIYLRLSKEDIEKEQDSHSRSIDNQKEILVQYAKVHDFELYDTYIDDDYSGLYYERPAFTRMLEDAAKHSFTVILAKSQSRLSRNMEHAEYLLHHLLPELGIRFIGVVDGTDTAQRYNKKTRQINALVNEWYCEDLSDNIRAVYRRKMAQGEYLGAYAPYGYRKSTQDSHRLEIDSYAAGWVKQIYLWYLAGESMKGIACRLQKAEVAAPVSYRRGEQPPDCHWSESTIKKILSNETYTGDVIQGKSRRRSFKDRKLQYMPKEQWVVVKNRHEPIISRKMYEQAKMLRRQRTLHTCVRYSGGER